MTEALKKPACEDPQPRTQMPALPPHMRSRSSLAFTTAAAEGLFKLQRCDNCTEVIYPAREICPKCWSLELRWEEVPAGGQLTTETTLHTSINTYFSERVPWRVGTVQLDVGPTVLAHVHGDVAERSRVKVIARTDKSGQGVLFALPDKETPHMADDKQLRTLTCDPKFRRVLITDGRTELGQAMAKAMAQAGASVIFVGLTESSRPFPGQETLAAIAEVELLSLDLTDAQSVEDLAAEIGHKVDILINTAQFVRPGASMDEKDVTTASDAMEINYFGLLRLIKAFGPTMRSRGGDDVNSACAWVNLLSVYALSNWSAFGTTSASQAAAYSLSQCLRAEFAGSGIKVINILSGPLDDSWHETVPPPKVTINKLTSAIVKALQQGIENVTLGPVAEAVVQGFREDPMILERVLSQIQQA